MVQHGAAPGANEDADVLQPPHHEGRIHHESREAAREQAWRQGRTPAGDPVFVGITNGRRDVQLLYDVEVYSDATR
nr:hypothetical protein OHB51_13720 [Micromonospora sp. NBC_00855]